MSKNRKIESAIVESVAAESVAAESVAAESANERKVRIEQFRLSLNRVTMRVVREKTESALFDQAEISTRSAEQETLVALEFGKLGLLAPKRLNRILALGTGQGLVLFRTRDFNSQTANFGPIIAWKESETLYHRNEKLASLGKRYVAHMQYNGKHYVRGGIIPSGMIVSPEGNIFRMSYVTGERMDHQNHESIWVSRIWENFENVVEFNASEAIITA